MSQFAVVLAAAGQSRRFGDPHTKKVFTQVGSKPLWMFAAETFAKRKDVAQIVIVISPDDKELFNEKYSGNAAMLGIEAVLGGRERAESVQNGLQAVRDDIPFVAVHDAARPCVADAWIDAVFTKAQETGAAILATPCASTLKRVRDEKIVETVPRDAIWLAQTPQVFRLDLLRSAYKQAANFVTATDEASLLEQIGHPVSVVPGSPLNIKVTTKEDLRFVEAALKTLPRPKGFPFG